ATFGAVVLAGTGSFEFARNRAGQSHRTDGWGALFGDEGSAHDIAREALRAAVRAEDGRGPATALHPAVLDYFDCETLRQVSRRIYGERMPRHEIARLAPRVTALAGTDHEARRIIEAAAARLADGVLTCLRRTAMLDDEFVLVLSGGVFRAGAVIVEPLCRAVLAQAPGARPLRPRFEPVYGALRLHFAASGVPWTSASEDRFVRSLDQRGAAADVLTG
ncbi:MAG TPA: BadF/BadG/BcrA/BcrD ATPase family protein, partial [Dehalococcoidia bacterium]|nr:BadF/BadG/BcrA/BcrD ATPase family protein [Dehalococcoidia bacterium]